MSSPISPNNRNKSVPLVVDLDGTLLSSDVLFESLNAFISRNPLGLGRAIQWLTQAKHIVKQELAERVELDPSSLPYNTEVLDLLRKEKASGRSLVLATASNQSTAEVIALYLGLFDKVIGSSREVNLKGSHKAQELVRLYGVQGFDYVGDSRADLEVWKFARVSYFAGSKAQVLERLTSFAKPQIIDTVPRKNFSNIVNMLRLHQWVKNLLIFVPLIATHRFFNVNDVFLALIAFFVFGCAASSIYIINDLVDLPNDRLHATKRFRPFASGKVALPVGWVSWPILLAIAFLVSVAFLPVSFTLTLTTYVVLTAAYSFGLKRIAILDVVVLAALYTLRIVAGAYAISAPPSYWILTFSLFFFLSLALMKRYSEIYDARLIGKQGRLGGRGYDDQDLELVFGFGIASAVISVFVFMLYIHDPAIVVLYSSPLILWLTGPLLLLWILRAWLIAHRGEMHVDPIVFAIKDKTSYFIAVALLLTFGLALVLP